MKPRAHRVCTFSRLFSDFQNSLALRNTTESSLTKGRSCFALRLIGQGTEMSVFFPHLSKAEHVRQTKNIREIHAFHASLPPARPSTDDKPGRPYFGTFDHTGADSVSRLHLGKGRKRSPDVFCCPEFVDWGLLTREQTCWWRLRRKYKGAMPESGIQVTCHPSLIPVTIRGTDSLIL